MHAWIEGDNLDLACLPPWQQWLVTRTEAGMGRLPLVVGGDCTITLGVISGFRRQHPDVGLVYVDGDADVGVPDSGGSGIFDSMGISHLLGRGAPELTGLAGAVPLLDPA